MKINIKGFWETRSIYVNGKWLDPKPSQKVYNHSPDGFNWGYGGSGPAQLALAIMLTIYPKNRALECYQTFKWDEVSKWPPSDFEKEINFDPQSLMETSL